MTRENDVSENLNERLRLIGSDAVFSDCRKYRYALWRRWEMEHPLILFIGLNPSTADETKNDPTIRRCINFAKDWGYGGVMIANLFAFRSTSPEIMKQQKDPIGKENDLWIGKLADASQSVIAAWGNHGIYLSRGFDVMELLRKSGKPIFHLGISKTGQPKHPLYISYEILPKIWVSQQL